MSDESDGFTRFNVKRDVFQHVILAFVGERDVFELDFTFEPVRFCIIQRFPFNVHQRKHPVAGSPRLFDERKWLTIRSYRFKKARKIIDERV